jgi:hypothetical protein
MFFIVPRTAERQASDMVKKQAPTDDCEHERFVLAGRPDAICALRQR